MERLASVVNGLPHLLGLVVESLDGVDVLLRLVAYSTEDVHKLVLETTARVVVPALIQRRNLKPNVQVYIVLLASLMSIVILLPRAGDNDELLAEGAGRMPVARELHLILGRELKGASVHFVALVQRLVVLVEIPASNEEQLVLWSEHCLEVVREIGHSDCGSFCQVLTLQFKFVDRLRIPLENVEGLAQSAAQVVWLDHILIIILLLGFIVLQGKTFHSLLMSKDQRVAHCPLARLTLEVEVLEETSEEVVHVHVKIDLQANGAPVLPFLL